MEGYEFDLEVCKCLPIESTRKVISYLDRFARQTKASVDMDKEFGITKNIIFGTVPSYQAVKDVANCFLERNDLTMEETCTLESIADFWKQEETLLKRGFYGQK